MLRHFAVAAFVGVILLVVVGVGCEKNAQSPEEAAKFFLESIKSGDRQNFDAVMLKSEVANALFEFAEAAKDFKAKMIASHGEVGWRNFQDADGARIHLSYQEAALGQLEFDVADDAASAKWPDDDEVLQLVRKEGKWFIDLEKTIDANLKEGEMNSKALASAFTTMTKITREYEPKVEDLTVDQLDKEMGAAFLTALLSEGAKPTVSVQVK